MELTTLLSGGFVGGLAGSWATHRFTINQESRARKIDFRGFLGRWLSDIQRVPNGDAIATYQAYVVNVQHFGGYAAKLSKDFYRKKRFRTLCKELGSLEPEEINNSNGDCREVVTEKIER